MNDKQREKYNLLNKYYRLNNLQTMNQTKYRSDGMECNITRSIIDTFLKIRNNVWFDEVKIAHVSLKNKGGYIVSDKMVLTSDGRVVALEIETDKYNTNRIDAYFGLPYFNEAFIIHPVDKYVAICENVDYIRTQLLKTGLI